jgi:hypothetical protein
MGNYRAFIMCVTLCWGLSLPAYAVEITVTSEDCAQLEQKEQPVNDAAYVPGVDAYGQPVPVAEADVPGDKIELPKKIRIPLDLNIAVPGDPGIRNPGRPFGRFESRAELGEITYDRDTGEFLLNGKKLPQNADVALRNACSSISVKQ